MHRAAQIVSVVLSILSAVVAAAGQAAAQEADLPAGPNREMVARECQACHDLVMVFGAAGLDREGWSSILEEMTGYGLRVTPEEQAKIVEYLTTYLGPSADKLAK